MNERQKGKAAPGANARPDASTMSYGQYLRLDRILDAQEPLSPDRNEMLFIIQHQTSELWMKLMLHELKGAIEGLRADKLPSVFKMLARVSRIMEQLVQAWSVLATMTPSEYTALRPYLGTSSGFQSFQYREIEFRLGNKNRAMLTPHATDPAVADELRQVLSEPSLYDEAIAVLARRGFPIDASLLHRDFTEKLAPNDSVQAAWTRVYREPEANFDLYELAEELVDLEDAFRLWRFRHVTTVERIIGFKRGTGGTAGVEYLRKMLDTVLFPELWRLRTEL
ncbi:MAG: tryptophan 2,3-dioxygenase [Hyphomicrobiales bacterium]|nr:tryptophan 2,3-dioxygenase [Hyphomicrobiales bacterium]MBV9738231.1 tryptophan 2,3-dioxygenase [Hyphomicrobiales bacterium]